jgi:TetR/AcrR family transcriptional regulator, ethionamide resistance regulator
MARDEHPTASPHRAPERRVQARRSRHESRERIVEAANELVRRRAYSGLSVDEVMREAGLGRTIFYRHFDDIAELLLRASREAIEELYEAQRRLSLEDPNALERAFEAAVDVYRHHGPLLRAVAEAAAGDEQIAHDYAALRGRFDDLAEEYLRGVTGAGSTPFADVTQTARALNLMNETYLLDAFGREPRVSPDTAVKTLTEIWAAAIRR